MLFNSLEFLIFLAVVYALYRALPFRGQNWMLLVASYVFYGWWDWRFLFLMIFTTSVDYWTGLMIDRGRLRSAEIVVPVVFLSSAALVLVGCDVGEILRVLRGGGRSAPVLTSFLPYVLIGIPAFLMIGTLTYRLLTSMSEDRRRRASVALSIVVQLSVLGFFKYFNFFTESLVEALGSVGIVAQASRFEIVLPVGISFYTFQAMSYSIDIYRRELKPTDRFFDFALFVSFFPQLVAGPIERAKNLLPQISLPRAVTSDQIQRGVFLIVFGLFKKVAIADGVAGPVDTIFGSGGTITWADAFIGTLLFTIQIYTDFSAYSDIARGVAKLFGIELMVNFRQPYFSKSPREFWQRWHISLSTWLGDYLYRPLGGNGGRLAFTIRNLMLTMVIGGLWHGAAWNFVLWGFYNGLLISLQRLTYVLRGKRAFTQTLLTVTLMFIGNGILILYGRLLFRAESFSQIWLFTSVLATGSGGLDYGGTMPRLSAVGGVLLLTVWEVAQYRRGGDARFYRELPLPIVGFAVACMIFLTFMGTSNEPAEFIYFQF